MEAWFLMKERAALDDFTRRWYDISGGGRQELWREIVGCWGFGDIFPDVPDDSTAGTYWHPGWLGH